MKKTIIILLCCIAALGCITVALAETPIQPFSVSANVEKTVPGNEIVWTTTVEDGADVEYCFYLFNGSTVIFKGTYSKDNVYKFTPTEPGNYRVQAYVKDGLARAGKYSAYVEVKAEYKPLTELSVVSDCPETKTGKPVTWTITADGTDATYCFYLYNGSDVIYKGTYSDNNIYTFIPAEPGNYRVQAYAKEGTTRISKYSEYVNVTENENPNGFEYVVNNDGRTCDITGPGEWNDTELVIPETIDGYPVTGIRSFAFEYCGNITSAMFPETLQSIDFMAFHNCKNLTEIRFSGYAELTVEPMAFYGCKALSDVWFDGTMKELLAKIHDKTELESYSSGTVEYHLYPDPVEIAIYVSPNGDDNADGKASSPIKTPDEAVKRIAALAEEDRIIPVNIYFSEGEYRTSGINFNSKVTGTATSPISFLSDGNVTLSGGITLDTSKFKTVDGAMAARLDEEQRQYVYVYDLGAEGITKAMLGTIEADGKSAEAFCNDARMTLARYPDEGFIKILSVFSETETGSDGGTVALFEEDNERAKRWLVEPDQIMLKGYVGVDWSMFTSPITSVNTNFHLIKIRDKSPYGLTKYGPFFLYNIFEELTAENEYYIDRESLMLYVYSEEDISTKKIVLSLLDAPIVKANGADNITFDGITFGYSKYNGFELSDCDNWTFRNCTIKNVGNWGMLFDGYNMLFADGEVYHTGFGGISVTGGDKEKLIDANNVVTNTYVHDWSQLKLTHGAGVEICGCGNTISHCEFARSPYFAIYYDGVDETIEYNYIHDVVQQSNDAGAIYCGRSWTSVNDVIRYNIIENVGNDEYSPIAIYWDDTLSGQTAYGNIVNNVGNLGMLIGGGHDNTVENNIFMNCKGYTIAVDSRGLSWNDLWLNFTNPDGLWADLEYYRNLDAWKERFPELQVLQRSKRTEPTYVKNPYNIVIKHNILIGTNGSTDALNTCSIVQKAIDIGTVEENYGYSRPSTCIDEETYELKSGIIPDIPGFEAIPVNEIGLIKK